MALGRRQQYRAKVLGMARNSSVIGWKWLGRAWGWESGGDPAGCGSIVPPPQLLLLGSKHPRGKSDLQTRVAL